MAAIQNLLRAVKREPLIRTPKSSLQTKRLQNALLALDAREAGASHREIAEALFGVRRVSEEHWKTSSLRQNVVRLCRLGEEMMTDGYSKLLAE